MGMFIQRQARADFSKITVVANGRGLPLVAFARYRCIEDTLTLTNRDGCNDSNRVTDTFFIA